MAGHLLVFDSSSETDSDDHFETEILEYVALRRTKSTKRAEIAFAFRLPVFIV